MTVRPRLVVFVLVVGVLTIGSALAGPALGTTAGVPMGATESVVSTDHPDSVVEQPSRAPRPQAFPAPFAQADDENDDGDADGEDDDSDEDDETHVINISTPGEPVQYTLTAPGLSPENDVDIEDDDGNESNQDVISGNSVAGFIGNGNYDAYEFTGSVDAVRLESANIDRLEVTIDGESVDPERLTGEGETETATTTTATTTEPTTAGTATETTGTEETHEIDVSVPGDNIDYTLTAPGLEPTDNVEAGENAEGAANPETIRGDTASGTIGNGAHDTYRFTGSVEEVRLESDDIDQLDVTIDGESVDPRTLTGEEAGTTTVSTDRASATTTGTGGSTTTAGPATTATTASSGAQSGQSGFGIVMFVLIGIVSGLVLAGALVYVVGSDRGG